MDGLRKSRRAQWMTIKALTSFAAIIDILTGMISIVRHF
jgi:hypothetical protein